MRQRQFETLRLQCEQVAEFNYRPTACRETYRMIVVRKNISREKGATRLFEEIRCFFYITNEWFAEPEEIVLAPCGANGRCHQENLLAQLHSGCHALHAPVDNLTSNWACMVMTALAWNLKAWWALTLPEGPGRWQEKHQTEKRWVLGLEFKTFVQTFVRLPCQLTRRAGRADQVRQILRRGVDRRIIRRLPRNDGGGAVEADEGAAGQRQPVGQVRVRDDYRRARIGHAEGKPLGRERRLKRHVGTQLPPQPNTGEASTGPEGGKDCA